MRSTLRLLLTLLSVLSLSYLCVYTTATVGNVPTSQPFELIPVDVNDVPEQFRAPSDRVNTAAPKTKSAKQIIPKRFREENNIPTLELDEAIFQDASSHIDSAQEVAQLAQKRLTSSLRTTSDNLLGNLLGDPVPSTIRDGVSQTFTLTAHEYHYYKFSATSSKWPYPIHFMVTPQYGDPDLFVRSSNSSSDTKLPNTTFYTWSSQRGTGYSESVLVFPSDLHACHPNTTTCTYYIAVYAYLNTSYSMLVRTGSTTTEVSNGEVVYYQYAPANNYTYYMFHNLFPNTNRTIAFSVTATFGEPEIYIDDRVEFPTSENSRWRETDIGSNVVGLTNCDSEFYYIGIKGSHNRYALFSLLTHSYDIHNPQDSATSLLINSALTDTLVFETFRYYYFHFEPLHDAPYLSVLVAKHAGETDLYVNFNADRILTPTHFPTDSNFQYSSVGTIQDHVINIYEPQAGFYYIGVKAKSRNSLYTIIMSAASDNTSNLQLYDGYHIPGAVSGGHHNYYQFRCYYAYDFLDLAFILTAHNGYGYLFLSDFDMHPNYNNYSSYNESAYTYSQSEIVLSVAKGNLHTGMYYLSVYAFSGSNFSYSITANFASKIYMRFGISYSDYLSEDTDQFYILNVPYKNENASDFLITVNSLYGYTNVFASIYPDPSSNNYYWSSQVSSSLVQTIHIPAYYCTNKLANETCTIYIQVVGTTDVSYTINSYLAGTFQLITNNRAVTGSVAEAVYVFYEFNVEFDNTNVTVTLTPSSGDVSLYISRSSYVDADHYYYSSVHDNTAVEKIQIDNAVSGMYYVAVFGVAENSQYTLTYSRTDPLATEIFDGKPQYMYLPYGTHHFYKFVAPSTGYPYPLTFSIRPDFGDPDLYVHLQRNAADKTLPLESNYSSYDWYSINGVSQVESVIIFPTSTPSCMPNTTTCTYFLSVHAYTGTSFYITARTGLTGTELINAVATTEHWVGTNEYQYYFFNNQYPNQNRSIAFAVTVIYGEPTIFIDDVIESPTSDNAKWRETALGSNVVGLTNCNSDFYYIGIKGGEFVFNRYSLVVHSYDPKNPQGTATALSINTPIDDILVFNTWRYYHLYLSYVITQVPPELAILVSRRVGEPVLYVSYSATYSLLAYPNTTHYNWKSTDEGSNIVSIADPPRGYYFIGVRADAHNTQYQLAASAQLTNSSSLTLYDGNLYPGFVRQGFYNYYTFNVNGNPTDDNELSFVVSPLHGRCGIYVSDLYKLPNRTAYNWSSTTTTNEVVVLTKGNGRLHRGPYYLGVYGFNNCSYSVVASYTSRFRFAMGTSVTGFLQEDREQFMQLSIPMTDGARDFTLTLSTNFGAAYLYVSRYHDPNRGEYDWEWASYTPGAHAQTVEIPASACSSLPRNGTCNFYILVFGVSETNYLIHAFYSNESRVVTSGQTVTGTLERDDYNFFKFNIPNDRMNVTIRVTPTSGNPDVYLHRWDGVNVDNFLLKSETSGVERIYFDWTTPEVQYENGIKGFWYIAVFGRTSCSYSMVVTIGNQTAGTVTLVNGQPIADDVIPNEVRYYQFTLSKTGWPYDVSVSMSTIVGYAYMTVITPDNTTLTADDHGLISIASDYTHSCNPNSRTCLYRVRITGYSWGIDTRYVLTYSTGHLPTVLSSGLSSTTTTTSFNGYEYYMITNPTKGFDVILGLNVLSGNPIMYVSVTEMFPSATNKNWSSTATNRVIGLYNQQYSVYYVAVHAERSGTLEASSTYSVLGRTIDPKHPENSAAYLNDGYSTLSLIPAGVYDYFVFYTYPTSGGAVIDGFTVTITPKTGSPVIYMDVVTDFSENAGWPTKEVGKHKYTSHNSGGNILITVDKSDIPTEFAEFRVGVVSTSNAEYAITVMEHGGFSYIGDGNEITNSLESHQYHYYYYYLYDRHDNTSWSVSVTSTAGNARLYVSDKVEKPIITDSKSYNWSSINLGINTIRLTPNSGTPSNPSLHSGYYYIGVYCASTAQCDYNIIVSYASSLTLTDGTAYESRLGTGGTRNMRFTVKGVAGEGSANVNLWELVLNTPVGQGQLLVGDNINKLPDYSDDSSYRWSSKSISNVQRLLFAESDCANGKTCVFYIQVYCPVSCFYHIQAASANASSQLVPGTPATGQVSAYGIYSKTYRFYIPSDDETVTLTLRMDPAAAMTSWPHMFVGLNNPSPAENASDFDTAKSATRVQTIYFDKSNPIIIARGGMKGTCYVTVYFDTANGNNQLIPFTLAVQLSEPVPESLIANRESAVNLAANGIYYFQFQISTSIVWPYTTTISLRVPSGTADMYVNNGNSLPTKTSYMWKVEGVQADNQLVVIDPTDGNACDPTNRGGATYCTYTIFISAREASLIRISATYSGADTNPEPSSGGNGAIIAVAIIIPLVAIIGGIAVYYYCCRGRSCNWSSSSKQDDFYGSHIEMNEAGTRSSSKKPKVRGQTFNRLLDDADSDYAHGGDDSSSYRPPRL